MNWMYEGGMGAGGWVLMSIVWLALVVLIVWAATRLFPWREGPQSTDHAPYSSPRDNEARAILDRRLASGEIDIETHDKLRERLSGGSSAGRK